LSVESNRRRLVLSFNQHAGVCAWTNEPDLAFRELAKLVNVPGV